MKKIINLILYPLLVLLLLTCAGAEEPAQWTWGDAAQTPVSTPMPPQPRITIDPQEREQRRRDAQAYAEFLESVIERFGLETEPARRYLPSNIDPVACLGYHYLTGGCRGQDYYAVYNGHSPELVRQYLRELQRWGYTIAPRPGNAEGMQEWHAESPSPHNGEEGLPESLRILYDAPMELLTVVYPYGAARDYARWAEEAADEAMRLWEAGQRTVSLGEGRTVQVEEYRYLTEVTVCTHGQTDLAQQLQSPADAKRMTVEAARLAGETRWLLRGKPCGSNGQWHFLCLKLSFGGKTDAAFAERFRIAVANGRDPAHCATLPLLLLQETEGGFAPWTGETGSLWALMPPRYAQAAEQLFVYLTDQAGPWIADLRQWNCYSLPR